MFVVYSACIGDVVSVLKKMCEESKIKKKSFVYHFLSFYFAKISHDWFEDGNVRWGWILPMEHACITTNSMGWIAATTIWAMLANMGPFLELPIE